MKKLLPLIVFFLWVGTSLGATYQITFEWDHSTSADATGYRVYMSPTSGQYTYGPANALASYGHVTTGQASVTMDEGARRYFVLTAFDAAGNESGPSNEISWTAPDVTPPAPPSNFLLKLWARLLAWLTTIRF